MLIATQSMWIANKHVNYNTYYVDKRANCNKVHVDSHKHAN